MTSLSASKCVVIKIGSALLVDSDKGVLKTDWLDSVSQDIAKLKSQGKSVLLVSSGAIAIGRQRLGLADKRLTLTEKQACAAAGQSLLTQAYEKSLSRYDIITAQALLTLHDTEDRRRWLNARATLETLLNFGAVPVINENDTVATDEIRYGDNDRLAARTAQMIGADTLILLSDIDGLYDADPRSDSNANHIPTITALTPEIVAMAGSANSSRNVGTGGMITKLMAAEIAMSAGCRMCIMNGHAPSPITRLESGELCSWFIPSHQPRQARQQWILGSLKPKGAIQIDEGAMSALNNGKSLLSIGVKKISGTFEKGDAVTVVGHGKEVARGLINYDHEAAQLILGKNSQDIHTILGYTNGPTLIHRDNLVMIQSRTS